MKIDLPLLVDNLAAVRERAELIEAVGADGLFSFEGPHEPFMGLVIAAGHTNRIELATGVAVALARNPMVVANLAHDLNRYSGGRFILGLGSQIKPHIQRRYSSTWANPVSQMKEFVEALHAIFSCWNQGTKLDFAGRYYTHTLMPPLFNPGPSGYPDPPIMLAGVGTKMVSVAGEVADLLLVHPFNTPTFIETVTLPALKTGAEKAGRSTSDIKLAIQCLIVTGNTEESYRNAFELTRTQLAFYASTPAYRCVLEAEGWGDLQQDLQQLTREGRWGELGSLLSDQIVERVAICGSPQDVVGKLKARFGSIAARLAIASPYEIDRNSLETIIAGLKSP